MSGGTCRAVFHRQSSIHNRPSLDLWDSSPGKRRLASQPSRCPFLKSTRRDERRCRPRSRCPVSGARSPKSERLVDSRQSVGLQAAMWTSASRLDPRGYRLARRAAVCRERGAPGLKRNYRIEAEPLMAHRMRVVRSRESRDCAG